MKRVDRKLASILNGSTSSVDFIIADAKDADMAFGASNVEQLAIKEKLFENSEITAAARANDTTDVWAVRGGRYATEHASRSFRSASIGHIKYGNLTDDHSRPFTGADLGLYSITFTNDIDWDHRALRDFADFRIEAERTGFRYFLEVFNPNVDPGILGGSAGTTLDAFQLIHGARKHGARVALFGRKINLSESPIAFIEFLRRVVDDEISPTDAVRAYHGVLQQTGIQPHRELDQDLHSTVGSPS